MIQIHKGATPPSLNRAGEGHVLELCAAYDTDPGGYRGDKRMAINSLIYSSDAVKESLMICQRGKCCYCETIFRKPYEYPHVEHWRPKSSWRQARDQGRTRPGYYWLAYSWDNLLLSCVFCNTSKSDLFPLEDPAARARHHGMTIEDEKAAILKPDGEEDPGSHITFHEEVPIGLTTIGRTTIDVLRLDSPAHEPRLRRLDEIREARKMSIDLMGIDHPYARNCTQRLRGFVEEAGRPDQPYSAMVANYLKENPLPDHPALDSE